MMSKAQKEFNEQYLDKCAFAAANFIASGVQKDWATFLGQAVCWGGDRERVKSARSWKLKPLTP